MNYVFVRSAEMHRGGGAKTGLPPPGAVPGAGAGEVSPPRSGTDPRAAGRHAPATPFWRRVHPLWRLPGGDAGPCRTPSTVEQPSMYSVTAEWSTQKCGQSYRQRAPHPRILGPCSGATDGQSATPPFYSCALIASHIETFLKVSHINKLNNILIGVLYVLSNYTVSQLII